MSDKATMDIPTASILLGISRGLGYDLARRGEFPVPIIRLGKRMVVSRMAIDQLLTLPRGPEKKQEPRHEVPK